MQGIVPTLVMVINPTVQYAMYEWGCNLWRRRRVQSARQKTLSSGEVFTISALAKLGATLATYPLLVVKNRIQVCLSSAFWHLQAVCRPTLSVRDFRL
jgi:solute carrier family 25 (peroxisomal adenine nucleotide transporter), member 17